LTAGADFVDLAISGKCSPVPHGTKSNCRSPRSEVRTALCGVAAVIGFVLSLSSSALNWLCRVAAVSAARASSVYPGEGVIVNIAPTPRLLCHCCDRSAHLAPHGHADHSTHGSSNRNARTDGHSFPGCFAGAAKARIKLAPKRPPGVDGFFKSNVVGRRQHYFIYLPPCMIQFCNAPIRCLSAARIPMMNALLDEAWRPPPTSCSVG